MIILLILVQNIGYLFHFHLIFRVIHLHLFLNFQGYIPLFLLYPRGRKFRLFRILGMKGLWFFWGFGDLRRLWFGFLWRFYFFFGVFLKCSRIRHSLIAGFGLLFGQPVWNLLFIFRSILMKRKRILIKGFWSFIFFILFY